jgi:hypothetical protein
VWLRDARGMRAVHHGVQGLTPAAMTAADIQRLAGGTMLLARRYSTIWP